VLVALYEEGGAVHTRLSPGDDALNAHPSYYNTRMSARSPLLAAGYSCVVPGAGQLYNGERAKGLAILCMATGILGGMLFSAVGPAALRSSVSVVFLGLIYVAVWIPAVGDAYQRAAGLPQTLLSGVTESRAACQERPSSSERTTPPRLPGGPSPSPQRISRPDATTARARQ